MATRQNSSNGKQKSPRIQVVLPEDLCKQLSELAEQESRTVSNMAKVLIQEGIRRSELTQSSGSSEVETNKTQDFIKALADASKLDLSIFEKWYLGKMEVNVSTGSNKPKKKYLYFQIH